MCPLLRLFLYSLDVAVVIVASVIPTVPTIDLVSPRPDTTLPSFLPSAHTTTPSHSSPANLSANILFVDVVYDGYRLTLTRYPAATFREVQAASVTGPTTNPNHLTDMRLIFSITQGDYRSVYTEMTGTWPQWGLPRLTTNVPSQDDEALPSRYGMDIVVADRYMKAAGFGQRYEAVDVRWPGSLPDGSRQAQYFFQMEAAGRVDFVAVGARSGRVFAHRRSDAEAAGRE